MITMGEFGVFGILTHGVEERLAHVKRSTIQHERVRSLLCESVR